MNKRLFRGVINEIRQINRGANRSKRGHGGGDGQNLVHSLDCGNRCGGRASGARSGWFLGRRRGAGAAVAFGAAVAGAAAGRGARGVREGPPGGNVGNLMVGAAEGLGGRLMRTVSFFGRTFESDGLGGTAPPGKLGMLSAINLFDAKLKSRRPGVKFLFWGNERGPESPAGISAVGDR